MMSEHKPANAAGLGTEPLPDIVAGALTLYQLYDLGDAINLDRAQACLATSIARRHTPPRGRQAESIQIAQPPLRVELGETPATLAGVAFAGTLRASIYDLGAVALALALPLPHPITWTTVADLLAAVQVLPAALQDHFSASLDELEALIASAIEGPNRVPMIEDYAVLL